MSSDPERDAEPEGVSPVGLLVEGLEVRYDEVVAVRDSDLTVGRHEIVALLGPSGCGKSTLLRAVAGLEPPSRGRISWKGRDLDGVAPHERRVGLMFQDHALFPHRNVADNVGFGPKMRGASVPEQRAIAEEMLATVRLPGFGSRRVEQLSGGEAQRVALARTLAASPELLLLDEPLGSLDRLLREELVLQLRELMSERGLAGLHVTHDHGEAFAMGDRVAVMIDGRIERVARPEELRLDPGSAAVARFLGIGALFAGEVDPGAGSVQLPFGMVTGVPHLVEAGARRCEVLVLPEAVQLLVDGDGDRTIAGRVSACTFQGDRFLIRLRMRGTDAELEAYSPSRLAPGHEVAVHIDGAGVRRVS